MLKRLINFTYFNNLCYDTQYTIKYLLTASLGKQYDLWTRLSHVTESRVHRLFPSSPINKC